MSGSWGHDPGALGILAEAIGSEHTAQSVLNEVAEDGWALMHRSAHPSVRLARWLDADPMREAATAYSGSYGWRCNLASPIGDGRYETFNVDRLPTRDAALSAALDQAEGVETDA